MQNYKKLVNTDMIMIPMFKKVRKWQLRNYNSTQTFLRYLTANKIKFRTRKIPTS